jgi:phosphate transport system permease protein
MTDLDLLDEPELDALYPEPDFDFTAPLTASGNLRRRQVVNVLAESGATVAAGIAIVVLGILVFAVVQRGGGAISFDFLTKDPPALGGSGGGIAPAIVGTAVIVALATAIAAPVGILIALYLTEFADRRAAGPIRLALDLLNGLPSIVIGLFVFGLMVAGHGQSGFAAGFALSIIMIPLVARSAQEMLLQVPTQMRDAADALGVSRWRSILGIVLPAARSGIVTGVILSIARAAGETAPLIFLCSIFPVGVHVNPFGHALSTIPVAIFTLSEQADPAGYERAWGAALVLLTFILLTNIGARVLLARSQRASR